MDVVRPTKAVRGTRKTFRASMENSVFPPSMGPLRTICTVSTQAAMKVPVLNATLMSRALSRCPARASTSPPSRGQASRKASGWRTASTSVVFQFFEMADVQAVELLADLEHEHAE